MKIIKKLPHWVLTNTRPAFYDTESGTAIEQTALLYKKMEELIESYNQFVDEINKEIDEFISNSLVDQEEFELKINQMIYDLTRLLDTELKSQDTQIKDAVNYLKDNLNATVNQEIYNMFERQELKLDFIYNPESEQLEFTGMVVTERSGE